MKNNIIKLVKWFCRQLTLNELSSLVPILLEVLSGQRSDIELKPEPKPPHYRKFRVDVVPPLTKPPEPQRLTPKDDWRRRLAEYPQNHDGKELRPIHRREGSLRPPPGTVCQCCGAPEPYLYLNDGKQGMQVSCKICGSRSCTHEPRRSSDADYFCPYCGWALFKWKEYPTETVYKCPNHHCPHHQANLAALTAEEKADRLNRSSQYKLHYQWREYHLSNADLAVIRPAADAKVNLRRIHHNSYVVGLVLTYTVDLGLSARQTRNALQWIYGIELSHQTVINYANAAAGILSPLVDRWAPSPTGTVSADETYIIVDGVWHYTWFVIDSVSRAICGYNLSTTRGTEPALALFLQTFGHPQAAPTQTFTTVRDGNPAYDTAANAYNQMSENGRKIELKTVIGLENLDAESEAYRSFKQLVERLNRTYKFHTRPRSGFKSFDGAVNLTTLFVAFYNFMRPHGSLNGKPPVKLECLNGMTNHPQMWQTLLMQA